MPETNLVPGEELSNPPDRPDPLAQHFDHEINEKYIRGEVRIVTEQARYPLNTVPTIVESSSYTLSPEYQRRHRWSAAKQSRLIESLIMNVPIPPIFLYEHEFSKYEVMDGLQRLTAIHDFYRDRVTLEGLEEWPELNGRKYSSLPDKIREGIDRRYLSSVILLKETARNEVDALRLKQLVFERINSGGEILTPQESRNAIYDGKLNQLCIRLSRNESLCRLWGIPLPNPSEVDTGIPSEDRIENDAFRKMEDVELVLRFFAYRQKHTLHRGVPLREYFDYYLSAGNSFSDDTLQRLAQLFEATITFAEELLGESAFWMYRNRNGTWKWLQRPTTSLYDAIMSTLARYLDRKADLIARCDDIRAQLPGFYEAEYAAFEGRDVNRNTLIQREEKFGAFIERFL